MPVSVSSSAKNGKSETALTMEFNEFVAWATGYVVLGIGKGQDIRDLLRYVIDCAVRNTAFGARRA